MLYGIFFPSLGGTELLLLFGLGILLFGSKLPGIGRTLGSAITQFKRGLSGEEDQPREPLPAGAPPRVTVSKPTFEGVPAKV